MRAQSSHTLEGALIVVLLALAGGMLYLVEISPSTADALMPFAATHRGHRGLLATPPMAGASVVRPGHVF